MSTESAINVPDSPPSWWQRQAERLSKDNERLLQWVRDLQDGRQVNCVYCGWNAGPREFAAAALAQQLYDHIASCSRHPMHGLKTENNRLRARVADLEPAEKALRELVTFSRAHQIYSPTTVAFEQNHLLNQAETALASRETKPAEDIQQAT